VDVLALFLLVPGLLLLLEARQGAPGPHVRTTAQAAQVVTAAGQSALAPAAGIAGAVPVLGAATPLQAPPSRLLWFGYLWLLCGSGYFLLRCLIDLAVVRRPALSPNLNLGGLAWLAGALVVCLGAVAVRKPAESIVPGGKRSAAVNETQRRAEDLIKQEIVHGDPDGSVAAFWVERGLAMACHLAIVVGLVIIGCRHFQDAPAGMAMATFYLLLPYTAYHVEQIHHVWPTALLVWAVAAYRKPTVSGTLLGLAAGTTYFPALIFPAWLSFYRQRGAGRFALAFLLTALVSLGTVGVILWAEGQLDRSLNFLFALADWQPWIQPKPDVEGFWTGMRWAWAYRLPVSIAFFAFVATTVFWPAPKNLAHVLALTAAILLGIQFWYADQGGVYVLWYLPFLLLLTFRPNLSDRQPPALQLETDWVMRTRRLLGRLLTRRPPTPERLAPLS
jgi:hypothetical protein